MAETTISSEAYRRCFAKSSSGPSFRSFSAFAAQHPVDNLNWLFFAFVRGDMAELQEKLIHCLQSLCVVASIPPAVIKEAMARALIATPLPLVPGIGHRFGEGSGSGIGDRRVCLAVEDDRGRRAFADVVIGRELL